jgi:Flp pilus assembly protein TadG
MKQTNESGQAIVEMAMGASFVLLMIMAIIDFGYMTYAKVTLQNAVRAAGRYAITGQCVGGAGTCTMTRYNSVVKNLQDASLGFLNTSNTGSYVTISCTNQGGGCPNGAGGPGDIVSIAVSYPYPFITPVISPFFPSRMYTIKVSAAYTNEAFPPSQS